VERSWDRSTGWNEVGSVLLGGAFYWVELSTGWSVLLGGTKLGAFYWVERSTGWNVLLGGSIYWVERSTGWNEVGRVLLEVSFLVMSSLLLRNYFCEQFFSLTC